jgi:hypothetical protein
MPSADQLALHFKLDISLHITWRVRAAGDGVIATERAALGLSLREK